MTRIEILTLTVGLVVASATALPFLWRVVRRSARVVVGGEQFLTEWNGTPTQPGIPRRLAAVEEQLDRMGHELFPNSGTSLRDAVDRLEARLDHLTPTTPTARTAPIPLPRAGDVSARGEPALGEDDARCR
ncbi:hypothetical protein H9Y04_44190 [Streptomyces sp. TRM66268-LWL]|uniref:Uncharacterized protein n=1 Tax=Streptomyces polyasparticus TaxID=2767826 RepID=A0ABR7SX41_9ACTN|nr:hypothetical protein [Streptomyces polyasparticus]MBC9719522.1 hypothetical protein [Streptomyces polyasparticus]